MSSKAFARSWHCFKDVHVLAPEASSGPEKLGPNLHEACCPIRIRTPQTWNPGPGLQFEDTHHGLNQGCEGLHEAVDKLQELSKGTFPSCLACTSSRQSGTLCLYRCEHRGGISLSLGWQTVMIPCRRLSSQLESWTSGYSSRMISTVW